MQFARDSKVAPAKAAVFQERVDTYEGRMESILETCEDAHKFLGFSKPVKTTKRSKKAKKKLTIV